MHVHHYSLGESSGSRYDVMTESTSPHSAKAPPRMAHTLERKRANERELPLLPELPELPEVPDEEEPPRSRSSNSALTGDTS